MGKQMPTNFKQFLAALSIDPRRDSMFESPRLVDRLYRMPIWSRSQVEDRVGQPESVSTFGGFVAMYYRVIEGEVMLCSRVSVEDAGNTLTDTVVGLDPVVNRFLEAAAKAGRLPKEN